MKIHKALVTRTAILVSLLFIAGCSQAPASTSTPLGKMEILLQKAYAIADKVTQETQGLLAVTYAEIPDHGQGRFGVHYNVFVIKRTDLLTPSDIKKVDEFVAEILKLTTQEIIVNEPSITHMGVMVVTPNFWFYGGFKRGPILVFEAPRAALLALGANAIADDWLGAARVSRFDSDNFQP